MTEATKKRTGGSKRYDDVADQLREHMEMRRIVTRMSGSLDRQEYTTSAQRELVTLCLTLLDKQASRLTGMEEAESILPDPSGTTTSPPPPPPPITQSGVDDLPGPRQSARPTVMHQSAMTASAFCEIVQRNYDSARSEEEREVARELLQRGMENHRDFADDPALVRLAEALRR